MKVLLINGSPEPARTTYTALREVADALEADGIETEIFHIGRKPIHSCTSCGWCFSQEGNGCVFKDDVVNEVIRKAEAADGFVFGSPVHYASASGAITALLDRCFFSSDAFIGKPGAAVVALRRGGGTAALDQLNKYFTISNMPTVGSQYWNMIHGTTPEEARQDEEGMQVMRTLGHNMAWLMKCIAAGKAAGVPMPPKEDRKWTNFIR